MKNTPGAFFTLVMIVSFAAVAQDAPGFVYVVKPGKTQLRAEPKTEAAAKGVVAYGQKLKVEEKQARWIRVSVPGDAAAGWIGAQIVVDKRPAIDQKAIGASASKMVVSEMSTAGAIRGLDHRTAQYAKDKQLSAGVIAHLAATESFGEQLFADRHNVDRNGRWRYPDVTVAGRVQNASTFAAAEGLRLPKK